MSNYFGLRPKQNIAESLKNEQWVYDNADYCISRCAFEDLRSVDTTNYNFYAGVRDVKQFDYITKTYGIPYPAKLKHIPLVVPYLKSLEGSQRTKGVDFTTYVTDIDSINDKITQKKNAIVAELIDSATKSGKSMTPEEAEAIIANIHKKYSANYKILSEVQSNKLLKHLIVKLGLDEKYAELFKDLLITGKMFYKINVIKEGEMPEIEIIDPRCIWWQQTDSKWVRDSQWAVIKRRMTPNEVLDAYGDQLDKEALNKIEDFTSAFLKSGNYKVNQTTNDYLMNNGSNVVTDEDFCWDVWDVEWKSIRAVKFIENENKFDSDSPFIKYLSEENYIKMPNEKKKKVKVRYVEDLWVCTRVGDDIYVNYGVNDKVVRDIDKPSKVNLTINGRVNTTRTEKVTSLIGQTKDIQDLYDILHFHKENLIALSGVKGSVMDLAQLPDFGTGSQPENIKMYFYYKKMGTAFINSSLEGYKGNFNQFQSYDDSLSQGVNVILAIITHLEELASRIIGVPRQMLGQISQNDGKATTQAAIQQSTVVTEPLFAEFYEVVGASLEDLLNAFKTSYNMGYKGSMVDDNGASNILELNKEFSLASIGVHVTNQYKDKIDKDKLQGFAMELVKAQKIDIKPIMSFFKDKSYFEIEKDLEDALNDQDNLQKALQQKEQELMQEFEAERQKMLEQMNALEKKSNADMINLKMIENKTYEDIENKKLDIDKEYKDQMIKLDEKRVELESQQLLFSNRAKEVKN